MVAEDGATEAAELLWGRVERGWPRGTAESGLAGDVDTFPYPLLWIAFFRECLIGMPREEAGRTFADQGRSLPGPTLTQLAGRRPGKAFGW